MAETGRTGKEGEKLDSGASRGPAHPHLALKPSFPYTVAVGNVQSPVDLIVVGAGPAGLFSAIAAAGAGLRVVLLEKQGGPGRKLLLAGSGMCNITHAGPVAGFLGRYGEAGRFVKPALHALDNRALALFFEERGLPLEEAHDGKMFPVCRDGRQVLSALVQECRGLGVRLELSERVRVVSRCDGGFLAASERQQWRSPLLIVATGGQSYPASGSSGDGFAFARELGHAVVAPAPALSPVLVWDWAFADCMGISLAGTAIRLYRDGKKLRETQGDVLFTHQGLSGPGILDFSRYIEPGDQVSVCLLPGLTGEAATPEALDACLRSALGANPGKAVRTVLSGLGLADQLAANLLARAGASAELRASAASRELRRGLAADLAGLACPVARLGDWKVAMATRGGVTRTEVDPKTMASRLAPGLYFAGEVLDVDGDTGGFNLQFAFSSGWLAGTSAAKSAIKEGNQP